ncbi:ClpXP adapter SpxH family protein [Falsibacillus albus]|uniref:ClpXP adapter protein SpxH n=1 Tax=Falsibacillus albus TaxID=2478915 RepID=A0A3L7K4H6_9BACI|nr:ClpXP adapter SpxH family protein [Falsibacillus albus]RLQ97179.1 DsbA family protein [Falsibacillus albus]
MGKPIWDNATGCGPDKKPLEIYMFIDPLCPECWALEPIVKKLQIRYGRYFTLKHVVSSQISRLNLGKKKNHVDIAELWEKTASRTGMSCDGTLWFENPICTPYLASMALKAAELQGKRAASKFLRKVQEYLFLNKENISNLDILMECAEAVGLDTEEFKKDLHSTSVAKALQCDLKITSEMEVSEIPTLVFFNENIEDEGLKVTGLYPFEVYVQIIMELLNEMPDPAPPPPLQKFLSHFNLVASKEIAEVYDMTIEEVEKEMKKWVLQQKVKKVPAKYGTFWRYIGEN